MLFLFDFDLVLMIAIVDSFWGMLLFWRYMVLENMFWLLYALFRGCIWVCVGILSNYRRKDGLGGRDEKR